MSTNEPPAASSSLSKIPRRRPSTHAISAPAPPPLRPSSPTRRDRCVSLPPSAPPSPVKTHARRSSRSAIPAPAPPPFSDLAASAAAPPPPSTPLQDRRRPSAGAHGADRPPDMRRTPSLSIYIPPPTSTAHPHVQLPPTDSGHPPTTRGDARPSRVRPSPTSAGPGSASSSPAPWTPRTRHASQPVPSSSSPSSASWPRPPRTPFPKRPAMAERTPSASTVATYVSFDRFDLEAPRTPAEERERQVAELRRERRNRRRWWWSRCRTAAAAADEDGEDESGRDEEEARAGETTALLRPSGRKEGQSRTEYVLGEVWCYARHMLPPILFFVVFVLVIALAAYRQAVARIVHPPQP
ncbi:hypothetical protein JCM3775_007155 [Rhodotorula graminis]